QMMIFVNAFTNSETVPVSALRTFLVLLNPFAPHLSSELWQRLNAKGAWPDGDITGQQWPDYDESFLVEDEVEIVLQINGKVRDHIKVSIDASDEEVKTAALNTAKIKDALGGRSATKVVVVPKKLVNIVAPN
ncbi:MAG: leucyl-tRNA synthetase, partial [Verrucomicrobiota bacterium]